MELAMVIAARVRSPSKPTSTGNALSPLRTPVMLATF